MTSYYGPPVGPDRFPARNRHMKLNRISDLKQQRTAYRKLGNARMADAFTVIINDLAKGLL
jgi:hypothetical protein